MRKARRAKASPCPPNLARAASMDINAWARRPLRSRASSDHGRLRFLPAARDRDPAPLYVPSKAARPLPCLSRCAQDSGLRRLAGGPLWPNRKTTLAGPIYVERKDCGRRNGRGGLIESPASSSLPANRHAVSNPHGQCRQIRQTAPPDGRMPRPLGECRLKAGPPSHREKRP